MLNSEQKKAVDEISNPLIVIAGPGTGKTTLIVEKIDYLINKKNISADKILALTFSNKAAEEMSVRAEKKINQPFFAKTFHKFAQEIIEEYQKYVPYIDKNYTLIDENAQLLFFLENISSFSLSSIEVKNNHVLIATELQSIISRLKDFGYSLSKFESFKSFDMSSKMDVFLAYSKYELYKKKNNYLDFGDLLLYLKDLLEKYEDVKSSIQKRFEYILVDEFQDTNKLQLEIVKLLTSGSNVTIVGDQKQSIYGFRGANYENLKDFKSYFKSYKEVFLHENYRSSKEVVDAVNKIILDFGMKEESLRSNRKESGGVRLIEAKSQDSQSSFILSRIEEIREKDKNASIGVLFRLRSDLREVASFLKGYGVKFSSGEASNFFENDVIKMIIGQCYIVANPREANVFFYQLLVDFGIRQEIVRKISRKSSIKEKSIYNVLEEGNLSEYEGEDRILRTILSKVNSLVELKNSKVSLYTLIREIVFKFNSYQKSIAQNQDENVQFINRFLKFVADYVKMYKNHSLESFLVLCEHTKDLDLSFDVDDMGVLGGVELLTVHSSKGKEFDYVILPYMNERRFPALFKRLKFEGIFEQDRKGFIDEEKRLFLVAVSRARREVDLVYVKKFEDNKLDSKLSQFVDVFGLQKVCYDREVEKYKLSLNDEIKFEIIEKIRNFILEGEFDLAIREVELLALLFGKKDLKHFFKSSSHSDYEFYYNKLNSRNNQKNLVDINSMVYSVSQLKTYESCPKKYLYQYIYKIPTQMRHYFDFGTSIHSVLEVISCEVDKYPKDVLFARGVAILKREWISKGYVDANQEREYFEKGVEAIRNFIERQSEMSEENRVVVFREEKFLLDFEGRKILGFIDRIDSVGDEIEILDYKTSNSIESDEDLKSNIQLFVYALAVKDKCDKYPKKLGLWYLIHNKISFVNFKDMAIDDLRAKILELIVSIEEGNFIPKPSFFSCKFCDFCGICKDCK